MACRKSKTTIAIVSSAAMAQGSTLARREVGLHEAVSFPGAETVCRANPRSRADWKRSSGSFSRQCLMMS